jgi:Uncharacterized protein conserved in bacteria (DUF2064)
MDPYKAQMLAETFVGDEPREWLGDPERSGISAKGIRICPRRKALLVFAQAVSLDLSQRVWPRRMQVLLNGLPITSDCLEGVDIHFFGCNGFVPAGDAPNRVHRQQGASFAERLENAIGTLARLGYDEIVVIGRDCPDLEFSDITQAFSLLESHRLVLGPDHRGGCYLIAFHVSDRSRLTQVRWQRNSDCRELEARFGCDTTFLLPIKHDLDSMDDVRVLARAASRWQPIAEELLQTLQPEFTPFRVVRVYSPLQKMKVQWQLPPPSSSL